MARLFERLFCRRGYHFVVEWWSLDRRDLQCQWCARVWRAEEVQRG